MNSSPTRRSRRLVVTAGLVLVAAFLALPSTVGAQSPEPFALTVTATVGEVLPDGSVVVSGKIRCNRDGSTTVFGGIEQTVGGTRVEGFFLLMNVACSAPLSRWRVTVAPAAAGARFVPGKAFFDAFVIRCETGGECTGGNVVDDAVPLG